MGGTKSKQEATGEVNNNIIIEGLEEHQSFLTNLVLFLLIIKIAELLLTIFKMYQKSMKKRYQLKIPAITP
jgi:hypothetical protein